VKLNWF